MTALSEPKTRTVAWTGIGLAASQLSRIAIALILARLLGPEPFAPVAAAAVYMTFVSLAVDLGLVAAIIQRPQLTERHLRLAALLSWACGLALAAGTAVVALALGSDFFLALAAAPLIRAIGVVPQARLYRQRRQHLVGKAEAAVAVLGLTCCVLAVSLGLGVFAYVVAVLATELALTALWLGLSRPFPWPAWHRGSFGELWSFSAKTLGSDALAVSTRNVDSILVGTLAGAGQLSLYSVGVRFLVTPVQFLGEVIVRVALPEFADRHRHGRPIGPVLLARTRSLSLTIWPALSAACVVAPWAVPAVLGREWTAAVPVTQVLCLVGAVQVAQGFLRPAMWSVGAVKPHLVFMVVVFVASTGTYAALARYGASGVAVGYAAVTFAAAPILAYLAARALRLPPWRTAGAVFYGAPAAAIVGLPVLALPVGAPVRAVAALGLLAVVLGVAHRAGLLVPGKEADQARTADDRQASSTHAVS
jgi:PST family polysaccharide transporter